eukprot:96833-Amphidinium_carterae.2
MGHVVSSVLGLATLAMQHQVCKRLLQVKLSSPALIHKREGSTLCRTSRRVLCPVGCGTQNDCHLTQVHML